MKIRLLILLVSLAALGGGQRAAFAQNAGAGRHNSSPGTSAQLSLPAANNGKHISAPGALLDDYETAAPGTLTFTFGGGYAAIPAGSDTWLPGTDLSIGLTPWLDLGLSSSLSKSIFEDFRTTAMGDAYISAKVRLLREGKHRPGIAFQPVLEVLGRPSLAENPLAPNKVNSAFGGIIGKQIKDTIRIYNHSGYFTRGIAFSSTAMEITRFAHITPAVFATFGALTGDGRRTAAELGLNSSRPDVGGTLGVRISKNWSAYGTFSRSLGRADLNSIRYSISGGISYTFKIWE